VAVKLLKELAGAMGRSSRGIDEAGAPCV
jgi:hypothetical protein